MTFDCIRTFCVIIIVLFLRKLAGEKAFKKVD